MSFLDLGLFLFLLEWPLIVCVFQGIDPFHLSCWSGELIGINNINSAQTPSENWREYFPNYYLGPVLFKYQPEKGIRSEENDRPISFMSKDTKILNNIISKKMQQYKKKGNIFSNKICSMNAKLV